MLAHRSQASEDDPSEGSLANSGDEQAPLEAVPAMSQNPFARAHALFQFRQFRIFCAPVNAKPAFLPFRFRGGGREEARGGGRKKRERTTFLLHVLKRESHLHVVLSGTCPEGARCRELST